MLSYDLRFALCNELCRVGTLVTTGSGYWRFGKVYGISLVVGLLNGLSFGDIFALRIASLNLFN